MDKSLVISDNEIKKKNNIIWNNSSTSKENISIPDFIEINADKIKKDYIDLIDNLENITVDNKKLYKKFAFSNNFSFFWITDIYEKSIYKNPKIVNQLKLIALKDVIKKIRPNTVEINLNNDEDAESIFKLCIYLNIKTNFKEKKQFRIKIYENFFVKLIFSFVKFLRFLYLRFSLKKVNFELLKKKKKLFFSYSIYSNFEKIKNGSFNSVYWDPLISKNYLNNDCAWCNIFFFQKKKLNFQSNLFNNLGDKHYNFFIEQLFDITIFFKILFYWFKNIIIINKIKKKIILNLKKSENIHLSKYIDREFTNSFVGLEGLTSLYYFFLLEKLSKKLIKMDKIFYLFENQGWEKSLNYHFSRSSLIAINHASIRYWDLRFNFNPNGKNKFIPKYYAANSKDSFNKLVENNFPQKKIVELESLRYYHLESQKIRFIDKPENLRNILIVSDFNDKSNSTIIDFLNNIDFKNLKKFNITLKEHPLKKIHVPKNIKLTKNQKSLIELRETNNLAIVSNTTTAINDLIILGYNVIALVDKSSINLSPLRGSKKINFVKNSYEILDKIEITAKITNNYIDESYQHYYYSEDLKLWQKILNES